MYPSLVPDGPAVKDGAFVELKLLKLEFLAPPECNGILGLPKNSLESPLRGSGSEFFGSANTALYFRSHSSNAFAACENLLKNDQHILYRFLPKYFDKNIFSSSYNIFFFLG